MNDATERKVYLPPVLESLDVDQTAGLIPIPINIGIGIGIGGGGHGGLGS